MIITIQHRNINQTAGLTFLHALPAWGRRCGRQSSVQAAWGSGVGWRWSSWTAARVTELGGVSAQVSKLVADSEAPQLGEHARRGRDGAEQWK